MERQIKIKYDPKRTYALESGAGHNVGLMSSGDLADLIASVTKIYCSPEGNDTFDGETEENAVKTIAKAIELAVTGDFEAVILMPGQHSYYASHNTFGKKIIAMSGARYLCIGTIYAANDSDQSKQKWQFGFSSFYDTKVQPFLSGYDPERSGTPFWNTGRADIPTDVEKANRLYLPAISDGGEMRLCRLRLYYDSGVFLANTPDPTENEWIVSDTLGDLEVYFSGQGYSSIAFPGPLGLSLRSSPAQSIVALGDGTGKVFVALKLKCDLAGGTDYREIITIWYNGAVQYWYELPLSPPAGFTENFRAPLCYGNADTAGPMICSGFSVAGSGSPLYSAVQPFKRYTDSGYVYEVSQTIGAGAVFYNSPPAVYYKGIPQFSTYQGDGKCYSAKQMSDALQSAGGVFGSLPAWALALFGTAIYTNALNRGHGYNGPYNYFNVAANLVANINPCSPFMTSEAMLSTDAASSTADPEFFDSAEALCDNLFYGGSAVNFLWYAEMPSNGLHESPYSLDKGFTSLAVHGLGVNTRLQNCEIFACDLGGQRRSYEESREIDFHLAYRKRESRIYLEAWFSTDFHTPDADVEASIFSNFIKAQTINRYAISRKDIDEARVRNLAVVNLYLIAENIELWHASAVSCAYATTNMALLHACCFAYFTGYYLTPDGSPVNLAYSFIRESLAQNLIPPDSTLTETMPVDPIFRSVVNPFDLRLQSISKGDFFESLAIGATPEVSAFGGPREAGAYDEKGSIETAWSEFDIVFPWVMSSESDRTRVSNRRRDGVRPKLSTGKNSIRLSLQWRLALSESDLRNIERLINADESLVQIYFNPIAKPDKFLLGYVDQSTKHGGPIGLMPNISEAVQIDFDCEQPAGSLYDFL